MPAPEYFGIAYRALGLNTEPALVARRKTAVESVAKTIDDELVPTLIAVAFKLEAPSVASLSQAFVDADASFDVNPDDTEFQALANLVLQNLFESTRTAAPLAALLYLTSSIQGRRSGSDLLRSAEACLSESQSKVLERPRDRRLVTFPSDLSKLHMGTEAIADPTAAIRSLARHTEVLHKFCVAMNSDWNRFASSLEAELAAYGWFSAGYSRTAERSFSDLPPIEASLRAACELVELSPGRFGLFPAPAILSGVISRGRIAGESANLVQAARLHQSLARGQVSISEELALLLPLSLASNESKGVEGDEEWVPRLKRKLGFDPQTMTLNDVDWANQAYLEGLVLESFNE